MEKLLLKLSLCCALLVGVASCQKVSSLSDASNIEHIAVVGCVPDKALFGDAVIKGNDIEIPLVYGKYLFPLTITFDVQVSAGCTQLLGFDGGGSTLSFDELGYARKIYTVAASGATTTWTIRITDAMSNESAEILRAEAKTTKVDNTQIAPTAIVDKFAATVTFQATGTEKYPLTVIPTITLAEGAHFTEELPTELIFENEEDITTITVESASGRVKQWTFTSAFVAPNDNSDVTDLSGDQVRRLTVDASKAGFASDIARLSSCQARFKVSYSIGGEIDFMVAPAGSDVITFPLTAQIIIPTNNQATLFGAPADNKYTFTGYNDKKEVWVADKISGLIKCWVIVLCPEMNTNLSAYTIGTFTCEDANIEVDKQNVEIDNDNSRVVIPVADKRGTAIDPKAKIILKINMALGLAEGTTCTSKTTSHTYLTNTGSLNLTTTNGLEKRLWTVYLKDKNAAVSADNSIANLSIVNYSSKDNRMELYSTSSVANNDTKTITFKITSGVDAFPLVISKKNIKTNNSATRIFPASVADYDSPIVFESLKSVVPFTAQAEDGSTDEWKIQLETSATGKTAEIESMLITDVSNDALPIDMVVDKANRHINIVVDGIPPFDFKVQFITSEQATVSGLQNGILSFDKYADRIPVLVTSQDGSALNTWTIGIERPEKVQLANSDFELWGTFKDINNNTFTIDPVPGAGYGWASANLSLLGIGVTGTLPIERADGTKAAEMTTSEQNTVIKGYLIASGTLFTGLFQLDIGNLDKPRKMTKFGVPFSARPASFDMDVRYNPGAQMKEARLEGSKYVIHDIEGVDKAHIWIELLQWTGEGDIDYDGNPSDKITVIGRTELVIDGTDNPYKEWTKINLPMSYNPQYDALTPTHIAIVFSSSKDGDKFRGAIGSKLGADHFHINY